MPANIVEQIKSAAVVIGLLLVVLWWNEPSAVEKVQAVMHSQRR